MMELSITQLTNFNNMRSLIRTLKYVLDIFPTEEAFTVEEYKHTHTTTTTATTTGTVDTTAKTHIGVNRSNRRPFILILN